MMNDDDYESDDDDESNNGYDAYKGINIETTGRLDMNNMAKEMLKLPL